MRACQLHIKCSWRGRKPRAQKSAPAKRPAPVAPIASPCAAATVDRGNREYIRRRLLHTIGDLSRELQRDSSAVIAAVKDIAAKNFAEQSTLRQTLDVSDLDTISVRDHVIGRMGAQA